MTVTDREFNMQKALNKHWKDLNVASFFQNYYPTHLFSFHVTTFKGLEISLEEAGKFLI